MPETMTGIRKKVWNYIESRCVNSCDYIIMPESNRISYYEKKYPNIPKPLLLENFPRKRDITAEKIDLFREIYPISIEQKIVLYSGSMGPERYIEELIESMSMCSEEFVLVIVGRAYKGYEETIREKIRNLGLSERVFLHEAVPHTEILQYMAACDIGVAFYRNTNLNNYYCASNKLYEYIALDKQILTNNYPGLLEAVEKFRQGLCLAEVTPKSLADSYIRVIDPLLITPGTKKFFWEDEQDILVQLYEK
jgi:glycosyltransferase involved in cell wall biosynthesis